MKSRLFPRLLNLFLLGCFLFTHNVFAQFPAFNNFAALTARTGGDDDKPAKIIALTRPRVFAVGSDAAPEKPKNALAGKAANVFDLERRAFSLINKKRSEAGLPALVWNEDLTRVARLHSENMAAYNFFSHTGQDGKLVNNRADIAGIKHWRSIGENIAYNRGFGDPTLCAVEKWMMSPGHRDNILKTNWKESGIGVAVTATGTFYFTQVFLIK